MTPTAGSTIAHDPSAGDIYDPDEVFPQNSPLMKPLRPKFRPSPSPPGPLAPVSPSPTAGDKSSNRRRKVRPSQGDAVLIFHLDGGKHPDIAAEAASRPLDQSSEDDDRSASDSDDTIEESGDEEDVRSNEMSPGPVSHFAKYPAESTGPGPIDLQFLATNALAAAKAASKTTDTDTDESQQPNHDARNTQRARLPERLVTMNGGAKENMIRKGVGRPVLAAPISPYPLQASQEIYSPRRPPPGQVLMHPNNVRSPPSLTPREHGELPPIQAASPKSDSNHDPLPSIRSQLYDQLTGPTKDLTMRQGPQLPHSPPPRIGPGIPGSHTSPPVSPNDLFRQGIPSPAHSIPATSPLYYSSASSTSHYRSGLDYSSSSNTETPNTDILTPATSITDRMSIDNVTNPQLGGFICTFQGCTAAPFQTQYLLNSHANVHSSARPHYCPVKGCPRSEGGKGFKRKNEMIRHGLVHDSPGYVCPFCPDREHKYPRPDNLQRHVRVHHIDKDKDDAALREVLSQRPDGPSRGRRRRGGP
ncbi:hypothetical protein F5X99DRAFT_415933 [Biscogniauxia marginata]|nr:hypothetical protein F5X99DRAFT_415933 [Biscogniauxia marginata]